MRGRKRGGERKGKKGERGRSSKKARRGKERKVWGGVQGGGAMDGGSVGAREKKRDEREGGEEVIGTVDRREGAETRPMSAAIVESATSDGSVQEAAVADTLDSEDNGRSISVDGERMGAESSADAEATVVGSLRTAAEGLGPIGEGSTCAEKTRSPERLVSEFGRARAAEAHGILAFGSDAAGAAVARSGALPALVSLLRDGDAEGRARAAGALGALASGSEAACDAVAQSGAIEGLVSLLRDGKDLGRMQAAAALGALALECDAACVAVS